MTVLKKGVRIGAAAFALGLSLAGPQAAGIAHADQETDSSSSAGEGRDSTSRHSAGAGIRAAARDGAKELPRAAAAEEPAPAVEVLDTVDLGTVDLGTVDLGTVDADSLDTGEVDPGTEVEPAENPAAEAEVEVEVVEIGAVEEPGEKPMAQPDQSEDQADDQAVAVEDVVETAGPTRGGPDPLPWWRSTAGTEDRPDLIDSSIFDDASEVDVPAEDSELDDVDATVPIALESSDGDETPRQTLFSGPAVKTPQDAITTLKVTVGLAFDRIGNWLSRLPASPLTDFLSGALILVRRTLNIPTIPKVSVDNVAVLESTPESPQQAVFTVSLDRAYDTEVTVGFATADLTDADAATAGLDYTPVAGFVTFAAGETTKQVFVPVLPDAVEESTETFGLNIYATLPSGSVRPSAVSVRMVDALAENQLTSVELASGTGVIVESGYVFLNAIKLTVVNQTGRKLEFKICKPGDYVGTTCGSSSSLSPGFSSTMSSIGALLSTDGPNVFGNVGALNFKAATSLLGPRLYLNGIDVPGERIQQSTWSENLNGDQNSWVYQAGFNSIKVERRPDVLTDDYFYGVLVMTVT